MPRIGTELLKFALSKFFVVCLFFELALATLVQAAINGR